VPKGTEGSDPSPSKGESANFGSAGDFDRTSALELRACRYEAAPDASTSSANRALSTSPPTPTECAVGTDPPPATHSTPVANDVLFPRPRLGVAEDVIARPRWNDAAGCWHSYSVWVKDVNDYRNTIVHGHWVVDKAAGEIYVVRFKTRGEFKRPRSAVTLSTNSLTSSTSRQTADELGALRDRLWNLNEAKRLSEARHLVKAERRFEGQILDEITVTTVL
jgi:hypothetical protein